MTSSDLKRVAVDVALGAVLVVAGAILQMIAGTIVNALDLVPVYYEMNPGPAHQPELLHQLNLTYFVMAALMLPLTLALGWALDTRDWRQGAARGAVWAAVIIAAQLLLGTGEGVADVMGNAGTWAYFATIVAGPVLAGSLRRRLRSPDEHEVARGTPVR